MKLENINNSIPSNFSKALFRLFHLFDRAFEKRLENLKLKSPCPSNHMYVHSRRSLSIMAHQFLQGGREGNRPTSGMWSEDWRGPNPKATIKSVWWKNSAAIVIVVQRSLFKYVLRSIYGEPNSYWTLLIT